MVSLEPGELIFGLESCAFLLGLPCSKIYRLINLMVKEGLISYDTESYSAFSLIKIKDWEMWQNSQNETPAGPSYEVFDGLGERVMKGIRKGSEIDVKGVRKGSEREVKTNNKGNNAKKGNNVKKGKNKMRKNPPDMMERYEKALAEERRMLDQ